MNTHAAIIIVVAGIGLVGCTMERTERPVEGRIRTEEEVKAEREAKERKEALAKKAAGATEPAVASIMDDPRYAGLDLKQRLQLQLEREPQNPKWHFELGALYEQEERVDLAVVRYRSGVALVDPDKYTGPHLFLGRALVKVGRLSEGMKELQRVVAIKPKNKQEYYANPHYREAHFLIGVVLHRGKFHKSAKVSFKKYIGLGGSPESVIPFYPEIVAEY